ncbi:hypothetical protein HDV04_002862 [Boothiomyces sp. JEL0838]|nr:hypothetical protein HDV04_002862 [Boothiomyces sp. JEL0838]
MSCQISKIVNEAPRQHRRSAKKTIKQEYVCTFDGCNAILYSKSSQFRHRRLHEKPSSRYECNQCKEQFLVKLDLIDHTRKTHMPAGSFVVCEQCNRTFSSLSNLNAHMEIHKQITDPTYNCEICNTKYFHRSALRRHQRADHKLLMGSNHYTRRFSESSSSDDSMSSYSHSPTTANDITNYRLPTPPLATCKICDYMSQTESELAQHLGSHFVSSDYKCIINACQYEIHSKEDFEQHTKCMHNKLFY